MPLGLLLHDVTRTISAGAKKLERWNDLVWLEQILIRRAEGAFIVQWFGRGVPVEGLHLRVAFANLDALQARYAAVMAELEQRRTAPESLNLTGPTMGLLGGLAGAIVSPMGATVLSIAALHAAWGATHWLALSLQALGGLLLGGVLSALGIGVGGTLGVGLAMPLAVLAAPAVASAPAVQRGHAFMGALAEMLDAMTVFLRQLLGPREGVRNPLVRRLLELGDRLGLLLPHLAGALAFVVVRSGTAVRALLDQLPAFVGLIRETAETVALLISNVAWHLARLITGPESIMARVREVVNAFTLFGQILAAVFDIMPGDLYHRVYVWWQQHEGEIAAWWKAATAALQDRLEQHPIGAAITEGMRRFRLARTIFASMAEEKPPEPPGFAGQLLERVQRDLVRYFTPPSLPTEAEINAGVGGPPLTPSGTTIQTLATLRATARETLNTLGLRQMARQVAPTPFEFSPATRARLERARRPGSVFTEVQLRDRAGRSVSEQLSRLRQQERPYREAIYQVVAHVMPREASAYIVELDDTLRALDETLYERRREPRDYEPPVRALLESRRLQPVVHRLVVRAPGSDETAVDRATLSNWTDGLRAVLEQQSYVAAE